MVRVTSDACRVQVALDNAAKRIIVLVGCPAGRSRKMPNRAKQVKMCGIPKFLPGGLLAGALALLFAAAASVTASAVTVGGSDNSPAQSAAAPRFSPAVADILKMVDAKVDGEVIKSFIKSSPI